MILLGTIIQTQIQRRSLKVSSGSQRIYDPAPILPVPQIRITPRGVVGILEDGMEIVDVHNIDHPESRNRGNSNGVSLNLVSNYVRMQQRFPNRWESSIILGLGGENLVVEQVPDFSADQIDTLLMLLTPTGDEFYLEQVTVIPPCAPFSNYLAGHELNAQDMRTTLEFLSDGTRGFYATLSTSYRDCTIRPGTKLYAV